MEFREKVRYSDCNIKAELSLPRILEIVEDAVSDECAEKGSDNILLREQYRAMWVVTKNKLRVVKAPRWNEELTVRCRCVKSTRLVCYFLTEFVDGDGQVRVSSLMENCVIDLDTARFRKLDSIPCPHGDEEIDINMKYAEPEYTESVPFTVEPMMIDYSRHLNNVKSLQVYFNSFSLEKLETLFAPSYEFTIHYCAQAFYMEQLILHKGENGNTYGFHVKNTDGRSVVKACLEIRE